MKKKHNIAIIGSGAFACAIYSTVKDVDNNDISIYFHDQDCYEAVLKAKKHPKMPCSFDNKTKLTMNFDEAVQNQQTIFLCCIFAVATEVVDKIVNTLSKDIELNIVICCKGILSEAPFFLYDYVKQKLPKCSVFIFSGGSFADEMCNKQDTIVNLSCEDKEKFSKLVPIFDNFLSLKYCNNPRATELLGALKNVIAIYTGYLSVNGSTNTTIKGIIDFITDTKVFFKNLSWDENLLLEPAGIGDIMLTCLSGKSRNRTFGELLATDKKKAKEYQQNTTIEGFDAVFAIQKFCRKKNITFKKVLDIQNKILAKS